jgi:DNA-binding FrmR family transcriptional regulator
MEIPELETEAIRKRLARAQGQLGGIIRMLKEGRECTDVLTQMAAAQAAINRAAFSLIASGMSHCAAGESGNADRQKLEKAFLALS